MTPITDFETILGEAHAAAKAAAKEAEEKATTWFPCGFAWVLIPDGRASIANYCRPRHAGHEAYYGSRGYPRGWQWWCPGHSTTQRLETYEAAARAFAEVLKRHGIDANVGSRMD